MYGSAIALSAILRNTGAAEALANNLWLIGLILLWFALWP